MSELREHVARNRAHWDAPARQFVEAGERAWPKEEPLWGLWQLAEAELQLLPERLAGKDAIELGCGTAYVSARLARRPRGRHRQLRGAAGHRAPTPAATRA